MRVLLRAQGAQERIHHFLPVSDFVFADMRAKLVAEYSAALAAPAPGANPEPNPESDLPTAAPAALPEAVSAGWGAVPCGAGGPIGGPEAVQLTASAGGAAKEAPRGQLLRQLSPSTPLAVSDDLVMSVAACAGKIFEEFPSEIMYYI